MKLRDVIFIVVVSVAIIILLSLVLGNPFDQSTRKNFEKIQNGMTRDECVRVLGSPTFESLCESWGAGAPIIWHRQGTKITVVIHNGVVTSKSIE